MTLFDTTTTRHTHDGNQYRVISGTYYPRSDRCGQQAYKIYLGNRLMGGYADNGGGSISPMTAVHDDWLCSADAQEIVAGEIRTLG